MSLLFGVIAPKNDSLGMGFFMNKDFFVKNIIASFFTLCLFKNMGAMQNEVSSASKSFIYNNTSQEKLKKKRQSFSFLFSKKDPENDTKTIKTNSLKNKMISSLSLSPKYDDELYKACLKGNSKEIEKYLENAKKNDTEIYINQGPIGMGIPLIIATHEGNINVINLLIKHGAHINIYDGLFNNSPLDVAWMNKNVEVFMELLKLGALPFKYKQDLDLIFSALPWKTFDKFAKNIKQCMNSSTSKINFFNIVQYLEWLKESIEKLSLSKNWCEKNLEQLRTTNPAIKTSDGYCIASDVRACGALISDLKMVIKFLKAYLLHFENNFNIADEEI